MPDNDTDGQGAIQSKGASQWERIVHFVRGDMEAARFCDQFFYITQVWDDLADGDRVRTPEDIDRAFWLALVELPGNRFYLRHGAELRTLVAAFVQDWFAANVLERGDGHDRSLAFVLRDRVGGLIAHCALLAGGYAWARQVNPDIRRLVHDETLSDYLRGLK
jgi:hypothetical protein